MLNRAKLYQIIKSVNESSYVTRRTRGGGNPQLFRIFPSNPLGRVEAPDVHRLEALEAQRDEALGHLLHLVVIQVASPTNPYKEAGAPD